MEQKRKAKISEIKVWYKFRLQLDIWFSDMKGRSAISPLHDEAWYDGPWFKYGYFAFIQCKWFAIHIMFKWWKINFPN